MTFPLQAVSGAIAARAETWTRLGIAWHTRPIAPNHGKPIIVAEFGAAAWLGALLIWNSGEAELETQRLTDSRTVNKHYDLTSSADLDVLLDELVALLADDRVPANAVVFHAPEPATREPRHGQ